MYVFFFFSSRRRHTRFDCDWSSDVCSSDLSHRTPSGPDCERGARRRDNRYHPCVHMDDDGRVWASVAPHVVSSLGGGDHCRRGLGLVLVQLDGETPMTAPPNMRLKPTGADK